MLLKLPFALFGLATLFHFLLLASLRALSLLTTACAAFAAQSGGASLLEAAVTAAITFMSVEIGVGFAGARLRGHPAAALLAPIIIVPTLVAGYSVGGLGAAWLGVEPALPGVGAALIAGLIATTSVTTKKNESDGPHSARCRVLATGQRSRLLLAFALLDRRDPRSLAHTGTGAPLSAGPFLCSPSANVARAP